MKISQFSHSVCRLWDHLLKCAHQSDSAIGLLDLKDITVTCPHSSCADRDLRRTRSKDVQNHGNGNSDSSLVLFVSLNFPPIHNHSFPSWN